MKIKHYKLLTLLGVGFITSFTTAPTLLDANASLTAPASYDFGYVYSGSVQQYVSSNGTSPTSIALFTRTTDGAYYNYSHTFSNLGSHSNTANYDLPVGLDITMTFNRSNTSWTNASPTYTGYYPTENKIGSDNTVSSLRKTYLKFDNQTNKNYFLYFDFSSSANQGHYYEVSYNSNDISNAYIDGFLLATNSTNFTKLYIPSYTNFEIYSRENTVSNYLDAWYLKDLGVSASFDAGYGAGQDDADLLVIGFQAMVGILVNFVLMVANLEVFGISLTGIFAIVVLFAGIVWTLKLIRG